MNRIEVRPEINEKRKPINNGGDHYTSVILWKECENE